MTNHHAETETQLSTLYRQIWPWVWTTLDSDKSLIWVEMRTEIIEFNKELHARIDDFNGRVSA